MITTTKGLMDETLLEKREGVVDNDTIILPLMAEPSPSLRGVRDAAISEIASARPRNDGDAAGFDEDAEFLRMLMAMDAGEPALLAVEDNEEELTHA
jgi:hypothetical protein